MQIKIKRGIINKAPVEITWTMKLLNSSRKDKVDKRIKKPKRQYENISHINIIDKHNRIQNSTKSK